ncbi:MAG: DUF3486 family protein [Ruminococcus sp.]|nr:DUF3486 family protein [Ruminococcus sp.]MDE7137602.1 DUF3486 family protein [Ruminococcus sp.]
MKKKKRKHSIIDGLPSDLREAVDEMIKTDFTYHEIVEYIRKNGVEISISSVQRYASGLNATLESLRLSQENFRAIMDETERYPDLDMTEGILRIASSRLLTAVNEMPESEINSKDMEALIKHTSALARAVAAKKRADIQNKEILEIGLEQFQSVLFDLMKEENPELYKANQKFIKKLQEKLS